MSDEPTRIEWAIFVAFLMGIGVGFVAARADCPPFLEAMAVDVDSERRVAFVETETRIVAADYVRRISLEKVEVEGSLKRTNKSDRKRRIRYRQSVPIDPTRRPWLEEGSPVCYDFQRSCLVRVFEATLDAGQTLDETLEWSVDLGLDADLDRDGKVDGSDRGLLLGDWSTDAERSDLNRDGVVDGSDLGILFERWTG